MKSLLFGMVLAFSFVAAAVPKYPLVSEVRGKVQWTNKDGKLETLKRKQVLTEKAAVETVGDAQVLLEVDAHRQLRLFANSRLEIPAISWETGDAPVLILKSGSLRWKQKPEKTYNIALRSDLFEFLSPTGDFIFSFDPKQAIAEVKVLAGQMEFSAMNAEDAALVGAGQKVRFTGVRESNEIVYDVLLKGKKIPRGKLGLVEPLSKEEKNLYSAAREQKEETARQQKAAAEEKAKELPKDPEAICQSPSAKLNQCAWVCEGNPKKESKSCRLERPEVSCVRKRCNANGEWAESTTIEKEKASGFCTGARAVVKACDY